MSDRGTHFITSTIFTLIEELMIHHQTSTPYHPQTNGTIVAFNKVLDNALRKVCNVTHDNWDEHVPIVLWAYRTKMKILTKYTPFRVIYGKGTMMPMDFLLLNLCVVVMTKMIEEGALK